MKDFEERKKLLRQHLHNKWDKLSENDLYEIGNDMTKLASRLAAAYNQSESDFAEAIAEFQAARAN